MRFCATSLGSIEVFASSNFTPLNYSLDTVSQFSNLFNSLSSNYFDISVSDGLNCSTSLDSVLLNLTTNLVLEVDSALETCRLNDGWISVIAQNDMEDINFQ